MELEFKLVQSSTLVMTRDPSSSLATIKATSRIKDISHETTTNCYMPFENVGGILQAASVSKGYWRSFGSLCKIAGYYGLEEGRVRQHSSHPDASLEHMKVTTCDRFRGLVVRSLRFAVVAASSRSNAVLGIIIRLKDTITRERQQHCPQII